MRTTKPLLIVALAAAGLTALPVASAAPTPSTPACSNLILTFVRSTGAAGSRGWDMALRNASSDKCRLDGFPRVTLLNSKASPVKVSVQHAAGFSAHAVTLRPWQSAFFSLVYVAGGKHSACTQHYFSASGLRVTPPGNRASVSYYSGPTAICAPSSAVGHPHVYPVRSRLNSM